MASSFGEQAGFKPGDHIHKFEVNNRLMTHHAGTFEIVDIEYGNIVLRRIEPGSIVFQEKSERIVTIPFTRIGTATLDLNGGFQLSAYLEHDDIEQANKLFEAELQRELDYYVLRARYWAGLIDVWKEKHQCREE